MSITRRIYFSLPQTAWRNGEEIGLSEAQLDLAQGLAARVHALGYLVEVFARYGLTESLTASMPWQSADVDRVMRRCAGAIFLGLPRWIWPVPGGEERFATEFSHCEAGVARTLGLPRLVLAEKGLSARVIFDMGKEYITLFPEGAGASWLGSPRFEHAWNGWRGRLNQRRDVFLGYAGKPAAPANGVKLYLERLGVTVLDWKTDFVPGSTILEQIQETADRCSGGIFLFTKDDPLVGEGERAAPRDNVVFEAGYFAAAKGKERVLIIRQEGAKMPADLGGDIYAALDDPSDIASIEDTIRKFVDEAL